MMNELEKAIFAAYLVKHLDASVNMAEAVNMASKQVMRFRAWMETGEGATKDAEQLLLSPTHAL